MEIDLIKEAKTIKKDLIGANVDFTFDDIIGSIKWTD